MMTTTYPDASVATSDVNHDDVKGVIMIENQGKNPK